ncbi:MAG: hypothetical protein WC454_10635 [Phycisphaerae bacterium]|jgi:hypothetical protein
MKIARVFPRKTAATPDDELAFFKEPPLLGMPEVDEVHISVAFTYDMRYAEYLADQWGVLGVPVKMGGPAFDQPGGEFVPGRYLKHGYVITSRGCPNRCVYADGQRCMVPEREGYRLRRLPITDGWNVLDDNLLACGEDHIRKVFDMLSRQPEKPKFTGGLEAKILKPWHVELLRKIKTKKMYFAYDTVDDYEPLVCAGKMLWDGGISAASHTAAVYVLIGYKGDTFEKANKRLEDTVKAGFMPYAMLYRDDKGDTDHTWKRFQREWLRPAIVGIKFKELSAI